MRRNRESSQICGFIHIFFIVVVKIAIFGHLGDGIASKDQDLILTHLRDSKDNRTDSTNDQIDDLGAQLYFPSHQLKDLYEFTALNNVFFDPAVASNDQQKISIIDLVNEEMWIINFVFDFD